MSHINGQFWGVNEFPGWIGTVTYSLIYLYLSFIPNGTQERFLWAKVCVELSIWASCLEYCSMSPGLRCAYSRWTGIWHIPYATAFSRRRARRMQYFRSSDISNRPLFDDLLRLQKSWWLFLSFYLFIAIDWGWRLHRRDLICKCLCLLCRRCCRWIIKWQGCRSHDLPMMSLLTKASRKAAHTFDSTEWEPIAMPFQCNESIEMLLL